MTARSTLSARRWLGVALVVLALAAFASIRDLEAHTGLRRSSPGKGAHLSTAPRELRLTFTEAVERPGARLTLVGPGGREVALGTLTVPPDSGRQLLAAITGPMQAGTYTVRWQITGRDGHPVRGEFVFVVAPGAAGTTSVLDDTTVARSDTAGHGVHAAAGDSATRAATHHDPTSFPTRSGGFDAESPLFVAVRWLTYVALLGLVGAVAFRFVVLGLAARRADASADAVIPTAAERAAAIGLACSALLLAAAVLRLVAQSIALHGLTAEAFDPGMAASMLTGTVWGWGWLLQVAAGALALFGFARARRHERSGWGLAAAAGMLAAVSPALSGHAAAAPRLAGLAVAADALHVVGAAGWLGSLAVLLFAGVPAAMRLDDRQRGPAVASLVNAFSPTALGFAALVALTGLFAGWLHLGRVDALWGSEYGRLLLLKVGVLGIVALTGAWNWLKVRPALGDDTGTALLRRSAGVEVAIAVVVVAITAVLVATSPPVHEGDVERSAQIRE